MFGSSQAGLFGGNGFLFSFNEGPFQTAFFFFQVMFCGTATTIFSGAVAERMKFSSYLLVAGILAVFIYPVFGHWAWNGLETGELSGWLGNRGFVDFAGSTVVHSVGGWIALAALLVIGPRRGRFPENGPPKEITAFSLPLSVLGVMLLWVGWFGFNGGSTLCLDRSVPAIITNTTLSASMGSAVCIIYVWLKTGLPKVTALINGTLGGLVAITAGCHSVNAMDAAIIGGVSGLVCVFVEQLLFRFKIDDAVGAIPVHLGCGIWGTLAVALFSDAERLGTGLGFWEQCLVQMEGIVAAGLLAFVIPYIAIRYIDRIWPMRVTEKEEENGLNVSEHGATTELHDLFDAMDGHAKTGDLSLRVPVEPFTEAGHIAIRYNQVMSALESVSLREEAIFRSASDAILTFTTDTHRILQANPSTCLMFGFSEPEAMIGMPITALFTEPDDAACKSLIDELLSRHHTELKGIRIGAQNFPVEGIVTESSIGNERFHVGIFRDISKRKAVEIEIQNQHALYRELFNSCPLGILMVDSQGKFVDVNKGFTDLFGYSSEEILGGRDLAVLVPEHLHEESKNALSSVLKGSTLKRETIRMDKAGQPIDVVLFMYPIRVNGEIQGVYNIYSDLRQRKEFENQLSHQAFHDALTGLPNRMLFFDRLTSAVNRKKRNDAFTYAAMMLDMDRFKTINDTLGHQIGDAFLVTVANRIKACLRDTDTVARLGGDEFGILLEDFNHLRQVVNITKRIMADLELPVVIEDNEIRSSASVGIVLKTGLYEDAKAIMRDADIALYRAKEVGRACFKVFNNKMHHQVVRENELEQELHAAIVNEELSVFYQPIVTVQGSVLMGFEALVRWHHPTRGIVSPVEFIPVAEETGQVIAIGQYVMKEACRQLAKWHKMTPSNKHLTVSVNVSAKQFQSTKLVKFVEDVLEEHGLSPQSLKLELTESTLMKDAKTSVKTMQELNKMGIQIIVDDFGTGYSSLSYIQRFPINGLKIDRSFISGGAQTENPKIVRTIIALAKSIGVKVVAEGVEEQNQLELLKAANCEYAQGYMFSKPISKEDVLKWFDLENEGSQKIAAHGGA